MKPIRAAIAVGVLLPMAACGAQAPAAFPTPAACVLQVVDTVPVESAGDPEGITADDGRVLVGALDGAVLDADTDDLAALDVLSAPTAQRIAAGGLDAAGGFVVVAGLRARVVDVVDVATGEVVSSRPAPGDSLPNDVVVSEGRVYVSDTQGNRVLAAPLGPDGRLGALTTLAELGDAVDEANGLALSPDGAALLVVGTGRGLARVEPATGAVTAVDGGAEVSGDGLHVLGGRLFTSIARFVTVLDVEPDGSAVALRGRVEVDAPAALATLTSDGQDLLVLSSGLRYIRSSPDNAVLRIDASGC